MQSINILEDKDPPTIPEGAADNDAEPAGTGGKHVVCQLIINPVVVAKNLSLKANR